MLSHQRALIMMIIVSMLIFDHIYADTSYAQALLTVRSSPQDPLIISELKVSPTKSEGQPWDLSPRSDPDPYLKIYIGGVLSWTSKISKDTIHPISKSAVSLTSVYRRAWSQVTGSAVMRLEVWDKDLTSDDFIAAFDLSKGQLQAMTQAPLALGTPSAHITLAWRSSQRIKKKRSPQGSPDVPHLRAQAEIPQLKVVHDVPGRPQPKPPHCESIPPASEVDLSVKTSLSLTTLLKRGEKLIRNNQAKISAAHLVVVPCRRGFDIHSKLKLGSGWVRLKDGEVRVVIHRPKVLRKFPKTHQIKRRVIRELCRRILKQKSPQCKKR